MEWIEGDRRAVPGSGLGDATELFTSASDVVTELDVPRAIDGADLRHHQTKGVVTGDPFLIRLC